jgi:hypothetical protein
VSKVCRDTIISLCDESGVWSAPYRRAGYRVIQVDLKLGGDARLWPSLPSATPRLSSEFADVRDYVGRVHGLLAAPVCTAFAGSGAKHRRGDEVILEGLALVDACARLAFVLNPDFWAAENPAGKLVKWLGEPLLRFQPNWYGDPYTKRTLLWGRFNPNLRRREVAATEGSKMWRLYGGKSERTKAARSETPPGFSEAFHEANP